jgi:hypothetical protein
VHWEEYRWKAMTLLSLPPIPRRPGWK